jgi:hypothetical protein
MKQLISIQSELKAPKNQFNSFGRYHYRNAEDILEGLKPLLLKYNCTLTISDEIKTAGDIIYVESTATIHHEEDSISVAAQAGIDINAKGMSPAQAFGASSSYARKYALGGLFLLDDSKDADATNTHGKESNQLQDALSKLSGMKTKAEAIEWAKTLPDHVKTHESFRQAFAKQF